MSSHPYPRIWDGKKAAQAHRIIWERAFGKIPEGYVIHHKDGNKHNNDLSNLQLMKSSEHKALHAQMKVCGEYVGHVLSKEERKMRHLESDKRWRGKDPERAKALHRENQRRYLLRKSKGLAHKAKKTER